MKQLIISIYDSWFNSSVLSNGKMNKKLEKELYDLYYCDDKYKEGNSFGKLVIKNYGDLYDNIIICEDGDVEVLK